MKRTLHRTRFASILAILLVAVTTGTTLFTHICFMSGEHRVSTSEISSCCAADGSEIMLHFLPPVAMITIRFLKFSFTASNHLAISNGWCSTDNWFLYFEYNVTNTTDHFVFRDLPPPVPARDLLIQYSVFRIWFLSLSDFCFPRRGNSLATIYRITQLKWNYLIYIILFTSSLSIQAQTISGHVIATTTRMKMQPLPGANIVWANTVIGGRYPMKPELYHANRSFCGNLLVISYVGYIADTVDVSK